MNKKWISKKDEDGNVKHIPIKERKPFGIPREKAVIDVEKLREMGKRARLIETNRNRKLYAPYEAVIDESGNLSPETNVIDESKNLTPETNVKEVEKAKSEINNADIKKTLHELGFINDEGNVRLNKNILSEFFPKHDYASYSSAIVRDGKLEFVTMDISHVAAVRKIIPTNLPNGIYDIYYDEDKLQLKMERTSDSNRAELLSKSLNQRFFDNYPKDKISVNLEGDQLKEFIKAIRNIKAEDYYSSGGIIFEKEANSDKLKIKFVDRYYTVNYQDLMETKVNDGISNSLKVEISAYMLYNVLKMLGKEKDINSISLDLKTHYPVQIHTKQKIDEPSNTYADSYGLVSPREE